MHLEISIDFNFISSHHQLVACLSPTFDLSTGDSIDITINLNGRGLLYSDFLLLIASNFNYLRKTGVVVSVTLDFIPNSDRANYASRINFFKLMEHPYQEEFTRRDPSGRFTEIRSFDKGNVLEQFKSIMKILLVNGIDESILTVLNFCLWEVLDNTLNHSGRTFTYGAGSGMVCAQYFPMNQEIRIMVADNGIGIHEALTTHPRSLYQGLTEREAVLRSVDRWVTNSVGMGFGLWAISQMMRLNGGELTIYSGNYQLKNNCIHKYGKWQGTFTFLKINTNVPVDHRLVFGESSNQHDMFQELKDDLLGDLENLW